jgi:hypothetical protein
MNFGVGGLWDVPCYVCGSALGTNKEHCGAGVGAKKKHARPPCVWAESDNTVVLTCQRKAKAKREEEEQREAQYILQQQLYKQRTLLNKEHQFTQGRSSSDDDDVFENPAPKRHSGGAAARKASTPKKAKTADTPNTPKETEKKKDPLDFTSDEEKDHRPPAAAKQLQVRAIDNEDAAEAGKPLPRPQDAVNAAQNTNEEDKEDSRMVWTHESKICLYGWVIQLNPFAAKRGSTDAAWNEVAAKCAESTKNATRKGGRIDVSGHGLQVYVGGQMKIMKGKALKEETQSGQGGLMSNHEKEEWGLLQQIYERKKERSDSKVVEKEEKDTLTKIKQDQLGEAIYQKAMKKEPIKNVYIKALNRKRKKVQVRYDAIKDANKACSDEQCLAKLCEEDRSVILMWAKAKKDGNVVTTGNEDSIEDSSDDELRRKGGKKKENVVDAIANLAGVGPMLLEAMKVETPLEQQMTQYFQRKAAAAHGARSDMTVQARLDRLAAAKSLMTAEEYAAQRLRILSESF